MKRMLIALVAGLAITMPLLGTAAPDEAQKQLIQRAQDAKKKLSAAQDDAGHVRNGHAGNGQEVGRGRCTDRREQDIGHD